MSGIEETIDLRELFIMVWRHIIFIATSMVVGLAIAFVVARFVLPPQYTSSVTMYVNNTSQTNMPSAVNINDINASQKLVNTYIVILRDDEVMEQIAQMLQQEYTQASLKRLIAYSEEDGEEVLSLDSLRDLISMSAVNNTEVLEIKAETKSSVLSARLCNLVTELAPSVLQRVVKAGSVEVIGAAKEAKRPSSPNVLLYTAIGGLLGLVLSALLSIFAEMMDTRVKDEKDLQQHYNIPILGAVPDFAAKSKGGYYGRQ